MRKIVASDYDGTLDQDGISAGTMEMIRKFRSEGNLFGIVTGRYYENGFEAFKKDQIPFDFVISHNGAVAFDSEGNVLFSHSADGRAERCGSPLAQTVVKKCLELSGNPCGVALEKKRLVFHPDSLKGLSLSILQDVDKFNLINVWCDTDERAAQITEILKEEYGDLLNPTQNGQAIDIPAAGVDKGTAIADYANYVKIPLDNVWTAGDNYNDIPMLKAYHGCAMTNSVAANAQVAEYICDDVAEVIKLAMDYKCWATGGQGL